MTDLFHHIIGDEAGETGLKFNRGSSIHFVVGLLLTNEPDALVAQVARFRRERRLEHAGELKFHSTPDANRLAFLGGLRPLEWEFRALVVDKRTLLGETRLNKQDFYVRFVTEALRWAAASCREARVLLDEFGNTAQTIPVIARRLRAEFGIGPGMPFREVPSAVRSESEPLLHVADMLTGAVLRRVEDGDTRIHLAVRPRTLLWRWGENENPPR